MSRYRVPTCPVPPARTIFIRAGTFCRNGSEPTGCSTGDKGRTAEHREQLQVAGIIKKQTRNRNNQKTSHPAAENVQVGTCLVCDHALRAAPLPVSDAPQAFSKASFSIKWTLLSVFTESCGRARKFLLLHGAKENPRRRDYTNSGKRANARLC